MLATLSATRLQRHAERILTDEAEVFGFEPGEFDPMLPRETTLSFRVTQSGTHNAMLTYFKARLDEHCMITSSPHAPQPLKSWRQIVTPLDAPAVRQNETFDVNVRFNAHTTPNFAYSRGQVFRSELRIRSGTALAGWLPASSRCLLGARFAPTTSSPPLGDHLEEGSSRLPPGARTPHGRRSTASHRAKSLHHISASPMPGWCGSTRSGRSRKTINPNR